MLCRDYLIYSYDHLSSLASLSREQEVGQAHQGTKDEPSPVAAWVSALRLRCKDNYVAAAVYNMDFVQHMALAVAVGIQDDDVEPFDVLQSQPLAVAGCCNCYGDDIPHSGVPGDFHATIEDLVECQSRQ